MTRAAHERPTCPSCGHKLPVRAEPHNKGAPFTTLERLAIATMVEEGATVAEMALAIGRSKSGVHRYLQSRRRAGEFPLSPRNRNRPIPPINGARRAEPTPVTRAELARILGRAGARSERVP